MSDARQVAIRTYVTAYERIAEDEQYAVALGEYDRAEYAHAIAARLARAVTAEMDDPEPQPTCLCHVCVTLGVRR